MPRKDKYEKLAVGREGWTWILGSRKWHYFRAGKALCGQFLLLSSAGLQMGGDDSPDNCALCRKRLKSHPAVNQNDPSPNPAVIRRRIQA